jgi:hypothetical protein
VGADVSLLRWQPESSGNVDPAPSVPEGQSGSKDGRVREDLSANLADRDTFQEDDRHMWSGNPIHFSVGVTSYEKQHLLRHRTGGRIDDPLS